MWFRGDTGFALCQACAVSGPPMLAAVMVGVLLDVPGGDGFDADLESALAKFGDAARRVFRTEALRRKNNLTS